MRYLPEFLRPNPVHEPRASEMAAAKALPADIPFLPANLDITFFYGKHSVKKDFEPLAELLPDADIFVPEMPLWRMSQIAYYSRISQGDRKAQREWEAEEKELAKGAGKINPFNAAELRAVLGSNLRITIMDYSSVDPKAEEINHHFDTWGLLNKVVPSWNQTLDNIVRYAEVEAALEDYRENLTLRSIGPRLLTLITEDPELTQKDRVKVVVQQGEAHSFYYPKFEALATQAESVTIRPVFDGEEQYLTEHFDQLAYSFREAGNVTRQQRRDLAMKALARIGLRFNAIPLVIRDSDRHGLIPVMPSPEEMVERFSIADIRKFHQKLVEADGQKAKN